MDSHTLLYDLIYNPDETLFIDDLKENCEAAEKLGIHTFQNVKFDDWLALRF